MKKLSKLASLLLVAALMMPSLTSLSAVPATTSAEQPQNTEPFIIEFDKILNMNQKSVGFLNKDDKNKYGSATVITEGENAPYIQLDYLKEGQQGNYFVMPNFLKKNLITEDHKYVRITYMTNDIAGATLTIKNNAGGTKNVLVPNTRESAGKWVTSDPVLVDASIIQRFINGGHNTLIYSNADPNAKFYIKSLAFFTSREQAFSYYGESYDGVTAIDTVALTFGTEGTGKISTNANYGKNEVNPKTGAVDITYAEATNFKNVHYMAKLSFSNKEMLPKAYRYFRVAYSGNNPEGVTGVNLTMRNDKTGKDSYIITDNMDTDGKAVLSKTFYATDESYDRLSGTGTYTNTGHFSFFTSCKEEGGLYSIHGVYFFASEEDANAFVLPEKIPSKIEINGNDISKYNIVIAKDASAKTVKAAELMMSLIYETSGVELPIITDDKPVSDYEIRIGFSNRNGTDKFPEGIDGEFTAFLDGNSIVITSAVAASLTSAVDGYLRAFLYYGTDKVPEIIKIDEKCVLTGSASNMTRYGKWDEKTNIKNPTVITDDFTTDSGYFTEDNGADVWKVSGGTYTAAAKDDLAATYVHVWESNVTVEAKMAYNFPTDKVYSSFGIVMRQTDIDSYIRAGYDAVKGEWFIDYREGADFYRLRAAEKSVKLTEKQYYDIKAVANGGTVTLYCDGKEVLKAENIPQKTTGRLGLFAENITCTADNFKASLDSGESVVWKNAHFTLIPIDTYFEGGTVIEMPDGSALFQHHHGKAYKSTDGGYTWEECDSWALSSGYINIIRLNDGSYLRTWKVSGSIISQRSTDGGKTWVDGGVITPITFNNEGIANAGNMNDKLMQTGSGLILYGQNYDGNGKKIDGREVFCQFFYSDDLGATWHVSETGSWEIEGNENEQYFGECKLLECADGTIRMYNSWNKYGCLVYADSTDGGKTFGPLHKMEQFSSTHSSMQFARDVYAENDSTYYMVWVYNVPEKDGANVPRNRLALAKTTDGKNWEYLGDFWRWEVDWRNGTSGVMLNHIVNPFIQVTENEVIAGTGISRYMGDTYHNEQRQHIWSVKKDTLPDGKKIMPFTDVPFGAPYYDAVEFAVENGLFNGTSATTFDPDVTMNRAMFVTVLGRLDKADVSKYTTPTFDDVKAGEWYTSYVEWAAANGIVNGMGGGKYGVTGTITVEQACTILYRYANGKIAVGDDVTDVPSISDFTDSASVSAWAADAVKWAVENGIYEGSGGKLDPTSAASRALVATMFANYVRVIA